MRRLKTSLFPAERLAQMVATGTLAMPDFQRDFVWEPSHVVDFLESVANNWPTGALLFLEAAPRGVRPIFNAKEFKDGPSLEGGRPEFYVLDGQQRLTALYHAYFDASSDTVYYADGNAVGEPDIIRAVARKRATQRLSRPGVILVRNVVGIAPQSQRPLWDDLSSVVESLRREMPGMAPGEYQLPVVVLPWDVELAALAKIFETVNRSGIRLNAFDLMVAILFPQGFNLRKEWITAQARYESLVHFEVDGVQILRLIALRKRAQEIRTEQPPRIKGIRQSDVLRVPGDFVEQQWEDAVFAFHEAIEFGRKWLGIVHPTLVPSDSMLLTAAALLPERGPASVEKWFWRSCLTQAHAQGTNTQVVADYDAAFGYKDAFGEAEEVKLDEIPSLLRQPLARNAIAARGLCCALVKQGARDVLSGQLLADIEPITELQIKSVAELLGHGPSRATVGDTVILPKGGISRVKAALENRDSRVIENLRSQQLGKLPLFEGQLFEEAQEEAQMERTHFFTRFIEKTL